MAASPLNGMMARGGSSGVLVKLGNAPGQIYILSAGHAAQFSSVDLINSAMATKNGRATLVNARLDHPNTVPVFNAQGLKVDVAIDAVTYATLTEQDVSLFHTTLSPSAAAAAGLRIYSIDWHGPDPGESVAVVSGCWQTAQLCTITYKFYQLQEAIFNWNGGFALSDECKLVGGWSGSPVISRKTGQVVAVANTVNGGGVNCTFGNPCEIDFRGTITSHPGRGYAQRVQNLPFCFTARGDLDLSLPTCRLPRANP